MDLKKRSTEDTEIPQRPQRKALVTEATEATEESWKPRKKAGASAPKARAVSRGRLSRASWDAVQAPPGSLPAVPEVAFGGPVRRVPHFLPCLPWNSVSSVTRQALNELRPTRWDLHLVGLCVFCGPPCLLRSCSPRAPEEPFLSRFVGSAKVFLGTCLRKAQCLSGMT